MNRVVVKNFNWIFDIKNATNCYYSTVNILHCTVATKVLIKSVD